MAKCPENTRATKQAVLDRNLALQMDIESSIQQLIGNREKVALRWKDSTNKVERSAYKAYIHLYNGLLKHMMENATILGKENYDHKEYLKLTQDFIQKHIFLHGSAITIFEDAHPRRMIAINALVSGLMNLHRSRFGKKLPVWERAILPTTLFSMRNDAFGYIHKYATKTKELLEDARHLASRWQDRNNAIVSKYASHIENLLASQRFISPDLIYGNLQIRTIQDIDEEDPRYMDEGVQDIYTRNKEMVTYFGTVERPDGRLVHLVIDQTTGEKKELAKEEISKESLIKGVMDHYVFRLTNDILHGQTRHITFKDTPTSEHMAEISEILKKKEFKRKHSKEEVKKGVPEIHYTQYGDETFIYAILKDKQGPKGTKSSWETHSAYLIRVESSDGVVNKFTGKNINKSFPTMEKLRGQARKDIRFRDGFYRSKEHRTYGGRFWESEKKGTQGLNIEDSERGWNFSQLGITYMTRQPNQVMVGEPITLADKRLEGAGLWDTVRNLRIMYNEIGTDLEKKAGEELLSIKEWLAKDGKLYKALTKHVPDQDVQKTLEKIRELFDINNRIWVDEKGNVHTPNSHFSKQKENYGPVIYDMQTIISRLLSTITEMETRKGEMSPDSQEYQDIDTKIKEFQLTLARIHEEFMRGDIRTLESELESVRDSGSIASGVIAERNVYMKHRAEWTDLNERKRGPEVHGEYLNSVYRSIAQNRMMVSMMETLTSTLLANKGELHQDTVGYLINRTKIAFGNPTAEGGIPGKVDWSTQKVADIMNKFSKDRHWEPEDAQKFLNWTKGFFGLSLLGYNTGLINRSQIVNNVIHWGFKHVVKSFRIVDGKDSTFTKDMVQAIIDNAGTDEVTNMVMDALTHGTDLELSDAGMIDLPFMPFQFPTNTMKDFLLMLKNNRKAFIDKGLPDGKVNEDLTERLHAIDDAHRKNQLQRIAKKKELLQGRMTKIGKAKFHAVFNTLEREEKRLNEPSAIKNTQMLRELYLDLIMTPKSQNNSKYLVARFSKLMGDVTDNRMKRMVAWKLSWWMDSFAPELFTMTEGERIMRKQTVIAALLTNADMGNLGTIDWKNTKDVQVLDKKTRKITVIPVPKAFLSDTAVRIARNAVNNTMFGMSAVHLGEAFVGMGQHFGLYKAYPLQQMLHDHNVVKTWLAGGVGGNAGTRFIDNTHRLYAAAKKAAIHASRGISYDPAGDYDHEALAVLRFIGLRVAATMISIVTEIVPPFRWLFRSPVARQFGYVMRGAENPALAIGLRLITNGLIMASFDEDDLFEGDMMEVGWDVMRLFFPVFLTLPLNLIANWVDE